MRAEFSLRTRASNLEAMVKEPLDVLVIGGGIVGAWVALTAALRGYRTGLVEKGDFASGTSGKTSRLIHGGLRYLQKFRIGLVRQAVRERDILLRTAGGFVKPLAFLIPVYKNRGPKGWHLRFGLFLYDALSRAKTLPRCRWVSRDEALKLEPGLEPRGLLRAALYHDAFTHDARLVVRVIRRAGETGALVANYARVIELLRSDGRVHGAKVRDEEKGSTEDVRATVVVNATGAWSNELQGPDGLQLRPTKGVHILVPRHRIGLGRAIVLPTSDGRIVFVLPWGQLCLIGTTDTDYRGSKEEVQADRRDVDYLLEVVNAGFPTAVLTREDVVSTYAGLRPLIDAGEGRESDISRKHEILVGDDGLVTVAGGKLTTARAIAEGVMDRVGARLAPRRPSEPVDTRRFALADPPPAHVLLGLARAGAPEDVISRLAEVFGPLLTEEWVAHDPDLLRPLGKGVSACGLELIYSARHEMVLHLDDVLVRRTGLFYEAADQGMGLAPRAADLVGETLGWDIRRRGMEVARFQGIAAAGNRWRKEVYPD